MPAFSSHALVTEALLALVSARTGRPSDVLTADLELAADLHLDSLTRVEILTALRTKLPGLPEIALTDLFRFRTLGEFQSALRTGHTPRPLRHVVTTVPRCLPGLRTAGLRGPLAITDDGNGVAHEVRKLLAAQGIEAAVTTTVPPGTTGVIFLGGLRDDLTAITAEALDAAQEPRELFVTVQDTGGDFGQSGTSGDRAAAGGLAGLTGQLRKEWPGSVVRALDVMRGPDAARLIVTELLHGGAASSVGYRDGVRRELVVEPLPAPDPDGSAHDVIVATGHSPVMLALARELRPKIVLLDAAATDPCPNARDHAAVARAILHQADDLSPVEATEQAAQVIAGRELRAHAQALTDAGAQVRFADDLDAVRVEWGPITGVVHTADTSLLDTVIAATADDPVAKVCVVLPTPTDRAQAVANEELIQRASAHGWTTVDQDAATDDTFVREFVGKGYAHVVAAPAEGAYRAEVTSAALLAESYSPLALMIEWFVAASGTCRLRDVSLLRDPSPGSGLTVHGRGDGVALASKVTHGRATTDDPRPPALLRTTLSTTVRGFRELGWPLAHTRTDPAATDECLRMAAGWAREEFGGTAVPTGVREFRVHRTGPLTGRGKAELAPGRVHDGRAECDVVLRDADDSPRVELLGVSLTRHPR